MRKNRLIAGTLLAIVALLQSACGGDAAYLLKKQVWNDISVFIEVRPNPPISGMNEILVVATRGDGRPASDMIVSVNSDSQEKPVQTIQDGHSGVYRRAVLLKDPMHESIKVTIESREKGASGHTVLEFPVTDTFAGPAR